MSKRIIRNVRRAKAFVTAEEVRTATVDIPRYELKKIPKTKIVYSHEQLKTSKMQNPLNDYIYIHDDNDFGRGFRNNNVRVSFTVSTDRNKPVNYAKSQILRYIRPPYSIAGLLFKARKPTRCRKAKNIRQHNAFKKVANGGTLNKPKNRYKC